MKTLAFLLIIMVATLGAKAQGILMNFGGEKTVAENQYGTAILIQSKSRWAFGGFYQTGVARIEQNSTIKNPFYGLMLLAPIAKAERITVYANMRVGIVNNDFIVIVPGIDTQANISKRIGVVVGTSLRMGYPSLSAKLITTIF